MGGAPWFEGPPSPSRAYALAPTHDPKVDGYFAHVAKYGGPLFQWGIIRAGLMWKLEVNPVNQWINFLHNQGRREGKTSYPPPLMLFKLDFLPPP